MPFVVNGTCRYTLHGLFYGRATATVLDYFIDTTGGTAGRTEAIDAMAGILINEWNDSLLPVQSSAWVFQKVSWVDLDEEDGVTGERNTSGSITLPKPGAITFNQGSANVAVLVKKVIDRKRGARSGRIYVPGFEEGMTGSTTGNEIQTANLTSWQTKCAAFLGDTNQSGGLVAGQPYDSWMVVSHILTRGPDKVFGGRYPHTEPGDPLTGEPLKVKSLQVQATLATQRRRIRG